jgi:ABC-type nitrate/sulfonate/bicarbonate transport system substrate-binding protein
MNAIAERVFRRTAPWAALAALLLLAACSREQVNAPPGGSAATPAAQELRYQGSVGAVTFPELAESLGYLAPVKLKWIGNTISGPQDIQTVVTGDVEFGTAFNGAVVKLIAARAPIRAVVGSYGVDDKTWSGYYVLEDSPIRSARDLIGKKVAVNTLGAHSEFILREYLARNGLTPAEAKQVELIVVPPVNGEQTLRQKQVDVASLGGILRDKALERGGVRRLFSDHDLFGSFTAGTYVFTERYIAAHPDTVRRFTEGVAKAVEWARTTPRDEVRARYAQIIQQRGRNEDGSLVQYWQSTGIAEPGGAIAEREFQIWIDWLVKEGELQPGQLKAGDLYTNTFNPLAPRRGEAS